MRPDNARAQSSRRRARKRHVTALRPISVRVLGLVAAVGLLAFAGVLVAPGQSVHRKAAPVDKGIWLSLEEIRRLPRGGEAWKRLRSAADGDLGKPELSDQNSVHDVNTLAAALVYARTGKESYRGKAAAAIATAIGTEDGGRTLALARNLVSYVIAADLINLREYDPQANSRFEKWLSDVRGESLAGLTLVQTNEKRPNNWGTHAGASRAAVDVYLGDRKDLERTAQVMRGWLGERSAYAGFVYRERKLDWASDEQNPTPVNPVGAAKDGYAIDGALPTEMRRGGKFQFPPKHTEYPWGALGGALVEAQILSRQGFDVWNWSDQALRRAAQFLYDLDQQYGDWSARGDDSWEPWVLNAVYGTTFPTEPAVEPGKNMGWTDWTHAP